MFILKFFFLGFFVCLFFNELDSHYVAQTGPELGSSNPISASE
jgi:hypothetical protein